MQSQNSSSPDPYGSTSDGRRPYSQTLHHFTQGSSNTDYISGPYDHNQPHFNPGDAYTLPGIPNERHHFNGTPMDLDPSHQLGIRGTGIPQWGMDTHTISDRNTDATPRIFSQAFDGPVWRTPGENRIVRPQQNQSRHRVTPSVNSFTQGAQDSGYRSFHGGSVPLSQKGDDRPSVISPDGPQRLSPNNMNHNFSSSMGLPVPVYSTQSETASTYGPSGAEQHHLWHLPPNSSHYCDVENCKENDKAMGHSEFKKHMQRHEKPWRCPVSGCKRTDGFATKNDLGRHLKSVHGKLTDNANVRNFLCQGRNCPHDSKVWPRLDNFKAHCKRLHKDEGLEDLIRRSEIPRRSRRPNDWGAHVARDASEVFAGSEAPTSPELSTLSAQKSPSSSRNSECRLAHSTLNTSLAGSTSIDLTSAVDYVEISQSLSESEIRQVSLGYVNTKTTPPIHISTEPPAKLVHDVAAPQQLEGVSSAELMSTTGLEESLESSREKGRFSSRYCDLLRERLESSFQNAQSGSLPLTTQRLAEVALASIQSLGQQLDADLCLGVENSGTAPMQDKQDTIPRSPLPDQNADKRTACTAAIDHSEPSAKRAKKEVIVLPKEKPTFKCKCGIVKTRKCDLKKHAMRHEKPWGCTHALCDKSFGSKNDWKRHENSQHERAQMWRCQEISKSSRIGICAKSFSTADKFRTHLSKEHNRRDDQYLKEQQRQARVGRNWQDRFWCGFCREIIKLECRGIQAWDERFNHIDEKHIRKGKRIGEWYPLDKDLPKSDLLKQAKPGKQRSLSISDDEDSEAMSGSICSQGTQHSHAQTPTPEPLLSDEETHANASQVPRETCSKSTERCSSEVISSDSG